MVPTAEPGVVVVAGEPRPGVAPAVVDLQAPAHPAPGHDAFGVAYLEGRAETGRDRLPAMGHRHDVDPAGEEDLQEGIVAHLAGQRHGDRPEPGDLALLAGDRVAPHES